MNLGFNFKLITHTQSKWWRKWDKVIEKKIEKQYILDLPFSSGKYVEESRD
jgi:hypothetical protein